MSRMVKLSKLCLKITDGSHYSPEGVKRGYPMLSSKDMGDMDFDFSNVKYISDEDYKVMVSSGCKPQINDVLIIKDGNSYLQKVFVVTEDRDIAILSSIGILRPNTELLDPFYLRYYLLSNHVKKEVAKKYVTGSALPRIILKNFGEIEIPYISLDKQKKIVSYLKDLDYKIENNNKIIAELESMAKTIYDYWFLQFEFPNEDGKPYKSSGGKMVWNEELKREIPEGWSTTTIGDITICHDSERMPLSGKDRENMVGDIPYYGATDIMGYVDKPIFDGDYVLLAEDGSVMDEEGHPILQRVTGQVWVNNHAHVLEPIKKHSCKLLMMFLKDVYVPMIKTGSIQMKINQENMNGITVPNIPDDLKEKINLELCTIEKKQLQIIAENQELTSLRDFLLPMLMNGQVGFKDGE